MTDLAQAAHRLQVEIFDLLAQGVAVETKDLGGADLVAARRGERGGEQRRFEIAQYAVVEANRGQVIAEGFEKLGDVAVETGGELLVAGAAIVRGGEARQISVADAN